MMKLPVYKLDINEWDEETGIEFVSLVEAPAIQKDFLAFVEVGQKESKDEFLTRCIKYVIDEGKPSEQAVAICNSMWDQHFSFAKVSFDWDGVGSTADGKIGRAHV